MTNQNHTETHLHRIHMEEVEMYLNLRKFHVFQHLHNGNYRTKKCFVYLIKRQLYHLKTRLKITQVGTKKILLFWYSKQLFIWNIENFYSYLIKL